MFLTKLEIVQTEKILPMKNIKHIRFVMSFTAMLLVACWDKNSAINRESCGNGYKKSSVTTMHVAV